MKLGWFLVHQPSFIFSVAKQIFGMELNER